MGRMENNTMMAVTHHGNFLAGSTSLNDHESTKIAITTLAQYQIVAIDMAGKRTNGSNKTDIMGGLGYWYVLLMSSPCSSPNIWGCQR